MPRQNPKSEIRNPKSSTLAPQHSSHLESAILKTLAYADIFDQALSLGELHHRLIGIRVEDTEQLSQLDEPKINQQNGLFFLTGRDELAKAKVSQLQTTNYKLQTARYWLWLFRLIPWLKLVALSGSVAAGTPRPDDDIDLLIITAKNRLWVSRLTTLLLLNLLGKRRKPSDNPTQVNNKFCLNMWLSEDDLISQDQDIYVAMELFNLMPILNRKHTYEAYLAANQWMEKLLPNALLNPNIESRNSKQVLNQKYLKFLHFQFVSSASWQIVFRISSFTNLIISPILNWLDRLAHSLQLNVMRPRTQETVTSTTLKFHPHDYRTEVLAKYRLKLDELGIN